MKLINGRGQVGTVLKEKIGSRNLWRDLTIYHTWNFLDKSVTIQSNCYNQFINYVNNHRGENIIFISTYTTNYSYYYHYKMLAELYLLEQTETGKIIRLPTLIGKGICVLMSEKKVVPYGDMEVLDLNEAADKIIECLPSDKRIIIVKGAIIKAKTVYALLHFKDTYEEL